MDIIAHIIGYIFRHAQLIDKFTVPDYRFVAQRIEILFYLKKRKHDKYNISIVY